MSAEIYVPPSEFADAEHDGDGFAYLEMDGVQVRLYRSTVTGRLRVQIDTDELAELGQPGDVWPGCGVPRLTVGVNDDDADIMEDGSWGTDR